MRPREAKCQVPAEEIVIRLATWNCCRASVAKTAEAVAALGASVTVLQEARRPAELPLGHIWVGKNSQNGLAVVPGAGYRVALGPVASSAPWSIVPVRVSGRQKLHLLMDSRRARRQTGKAGEAAHGSRHRVTVRGQTQRSVSGRDRRAD